jgi:hypothetical protein
MNKKMMFAIVMIPVIVIALFVVVKHVPAGLIHHKVRIINASGWTARIALFTGNDHQYTATVNDGAEHTFEVGAKCPKFLLGIVEAGYPVKTDTKIDQYYCVRSGDHAVSPAGCIISCKSSQHTLKRMVRADGRSSYYFQKD